MRSGEEEQTVCAPKGGAAAVCVLRERVDLHPPRTAHGGAVPLVLKDTSLKITWRKTEKKEEEKRKGENSNL